MAMYRRCSVCNKKVPEDELCKCEQQKRLDSYKDYKRRRMMDKEEKERQQFYNSVAWQKLTELIKKHFFGMCVMCWDKGLVEEGKYTHHIKTIKDRFDLRLDKDNLVCLCPSCHQDVHREMDKSVKDKVVIQKALKELICKFEEEYY